MESVALTFLKCIQMVKNLMTMEISQYSYLSLSAALKYVYTVTCSDTQSSALALQSLALAVAWNKGSHCLWQAAFMAYKNLSKLKFFLLEPQKISTSDFSR